MEHTAVSFLKSIRSGRGYSVTCQPSSMGSTVDSTHRVGWASIISGLACNDEKTYLIRSIDRIRISKTTSGAWLKQKQIASMNKIYGLPLRVTRDNPNHHLWNNNGVWWLHYTVYPTAVTSERVRKSLRTRSLEIARARRDRLFRNLRKNMQAA